MTTDLEWKRMDDIVRGFGLFQIMCQRCHTYKKDQLSRRGPNVYGIVGRQAGMGGTFFLLCCNPPDPQLIGLSDYKKCCISR